MKSRAAVLAAGPAGTALLGWLRVPRPLAFCPASPGGGRAVIAQRRSPYLGRLCKARGREGPGRRLSRLSGQACARGRGPGRGRLGVFPPETPPRTGGSERRATLPSARICDVGPVTHLLLVCRHLLCALGVKITISDVLVRIRNNNAGEPLNSARQVHQVQVNGGHAKILCAWLDSCPSTANPSVVFSFPL